MRHLVSLAILTSLFAMLPGQAQALIRWENDLESAKQLARRTNRLVLVHFWSDDCPPCRVVEKNVFPRSDVQRAMDSAYVAVKIHGRRQSHLTEQLNVRGWPTDIIMTPDGKEIYRTVSPQQPSDYIRLLDAVAAHVRVNQSPAHVAERPQARTPQSPTSPGYQRASRFTSSGVPAKPPTAPLPSAGAGAQNPGPTASRYGGNRFNTPQTGSRYGAPQSQPNQRQLAGAPQQPPQHSVQDNPYVQNSKPQTSNAQQPSATNQAQLGNLAANEIVNTTTAKTPAFGANPSAPRTRVADTRGANTAAATDPASRYGARNPRRQTQAAAASNSAANGTKTATAPTTPATPSNQTPAASRYGSTQNAEQPATSARKQSLAASAPNLPAAGGSRYGGIIPPTGTPASTETPTTNRATGAPPSGSSTVSRYGSQAPVGQTQPAARAPSSGRAGQPSQYAPTYAQQPQQQPQAGQPTANAAGRHPGPNRSAQTGMQQPGMQQPGMQQPGVQPRTNQSMAPVTRQPVANQQLALDGFCPVTLQRQRVWKQGDARFAVQHRGKIYHCAGPQEARQFQTNPDYFCPLLSGFDPVRLVHQNQLVAGRREFGMWHDDQMLLFVDEASLKAFWDAPDKYMAVVRQAMAGQQPPTRR